MKLRLRSPRKLASVLISAARRDREEVADYLDSRREEWEALAEAAPGDAADVLEQLTEEDAAELLGDLEPADAAEVLTEIAPELAAELVEDVPIDELTAALREMSAEAAADLLLELDDSISDAILDRLDDLVEVDLRRLMGYPPDSAGGLMTTEIAALPLGLTTGEATERIRQLVDEYEDLSYVYVVDDEGLLKGVVSFRDLVFKRPGTALGEVMVPDPVVVTAFSDREEVAELCQRYHLLGVPVTDAHGRLLGMVTNDSVIEVIQDEATEDFAAAVGAGVAETVYTDISESFRVRAPWLVLNLFLALVVALAIDSQNGVLRSHPVLAALMPLVALLGGNSGNQALAVMIRSLASDDVPGAQVRSIVGRQAAVGALNGMVVGLFGLAVTLGLNSVGLLETETHPLVLASIVGFAIFANLIIATVAGTTIPLILRRLGLDPALASAIFLTMLTDVVGFGGFLLLANALL